jgi:hypothetical protein
MDNKSMLEANPNPVILQSEGLLKVYPKTTQGRPSFWQKKTHVNL